jgi:hypothetical protein
VSIPVRLPSVRREASGKDGRGWEKGRIRTLLELTEIGVAQYDPSLEDLAGDDGSVGVRSDRQSPDHLLTRRLKDEFFPVRSRSFEVDRRPDGILERVLGDEEVTCVLERFLGAVEEEDGGIGEGALTESHHSKGLEHDGDTDEVVCCAGRRKCRVGVGVDENCVSFRGGSAVGEADDDAVGGREGRRESA